MSHKNSQLWETLSEELFTQIDDHFLDTFREPEGPNGRLAAWGPYDPTMRYFKFILFGAARRRADEFFQCYQKLGTTDIGNPVTVRVRGLDINLDYLFSIDEFLFLNSEMDLQKIQSVIEIGAGFGRTCHALTKLIPGLTSYTIVDLPQILDLSRKFLTRVVPDQMEKIRFVDALDERSWDGLAADLVININSFQEMPPETIDNYYEAIIRKSESLFIKNPVGKYSPESIGLTIKNPDQLHDVFRLGYCREIVDIFDEDSLMKAREGFVTAYSPGSSWRVAATAPMEVFPYYHSALYQRAV